MYVLKVYVGLLFGQQILHVIASHIMQFGKENISLNVMVIYFTYTVLLQFFPLAYISMFVLYVFPRLLRMNSCAHTVVNIYIPVISVIRHSAGRVA